MRNILPTPRSSLIRRTIGGAVAIWAVGIFSGLAAQAQRGGLFNLVDFNLFSADQEIELGKEASAKVEKEQEIVKDAWLSAYIGRVGGDLTAQLEDQSFPFRFSVVRDESVNAFALPGGPIYIHTGLLELADNEAQLASVLAHEVSHVVLRHSAKAISKQKAVELPLVLAQ